MADEDSGVGRPESVGQAMNLVLQAEREAEQAIVDCEHRAREMLHAAQQRARRIAERTNKRITLMQMRCAQAVRARIKTLERAEETATAEHNADRLEPAVLAALVEEVAARLSGDKSSPGGERKR